MSNTIKFISDKKYAYMSNFYHSPFKFEGINYDSVEHAYQALKTEDPSWRKKIRKAPYPGMAKKLGRSAPLRKDWDNIKRLLMKNLVRAKFEQHSDLASMLVFTSGPIEEDAYWDNYWGTGRAGNGSNHMGKILMEIREELKNEW